MATGGGEGQMGRGRPEEGGMATGGGHGQRGRVWPQGNGTATGGGDGHRRRELSPWRSRTRLTDSRDITSVPSPRLSSTWTSAARRHPDTTAQAPCRPATPTQRTYFSRRLCSSFLMSASSISESLSLLM